MSKRILTLTLCIMMVFTVAGCGDESSSGIDIDFTAVVEEMKKTDTSMPETNTVTEASDNAETTMSMLAEGFDYSGIEKFIYCYSTTGSPEEIAIIKTKGKSGVGDLMKSLQSHIDARKSTFQAYSPEKAEVVDKAVLTFSENYVFMAIGSTSGAMQDIFKKNFE